MTTLSPKETPKYKKYPRNPSGTITAAPKETLEDIYNAAYKEPYSGSLQRRLKEQVINNHIKYHRSKPKLEEE